jgi:hypothetical protein
MKTDAKIDMLHHSGLFGRVTGKARDRTSDVSEDVDAERSMSTVSGNPAVVPRRTNV